MPYTPVLISASTLSGDEVKNADGEKLGHVKDIMIDTENNSVAYYVLSFGGLLGMGDKLFAIPPEAVALNTQEKCLTLNVEKKQLENAKGFHKDKWPNMADPAFRNSLYKYYNISDRSAA